MGHDSAPAGTRLYMLCVRMPWGTTSTTFVATSDAEAIDTGQAMVAATSAEISGLGGSEVRLRRPDGSEVWRPTSIAQLLRDLRAVELQTTAA